MEDAIENNLSDLERWIAQAETGDKTALAELYAYYKPRLRRIVAARLDPRLKGRIDPSDVLQEAFLDLQKKLPNYVDREHKLSMFLWMRMVASESVINSHRKHMQAQNRDARREVPYHESAESSASHVLVGQLVGQFTSAANRLLHKEMQAALMSAIESLSETDREIIMMRNFEDLTNQEIAEALGLSISGTSNRYVRAMHRLVAELKKIPGFMDSHN